MKKKSFLKMILTLTICVVMAMSTTACNLVFDLGHETLNPETPNEQDNVTPNEEYGEINIQLPESFDIMTIAHQADAADYYNGGEVKTIGNMIAAEVYQRLSLITYEPEIPGYVSHRLSLATYKLITKPMQFPRLIVTLYAGGEKLFSLGIDEEGTMGSSGVHGNFIQNDKTLYRYLMGVFTNSAD